MTDAEQVREHTISCLRDVKLDLRLLEMTTNVVVVEQAIELIQSLSSKLDAAGIEKARMLADYNEAIANTHVLHKKLDAQEKAGKMLAEGVADSLKLLRAIQKDLWLRADIDRRDGGKVVHLSNSTWRKLCEAVGEPE